MTDHDINAKPTTLELFSAMCSAQIVSKSDWIVLTVLIHRANRHKNYSCYPSYRRMAEDTQLSVWTLQQAVARLLQRNLIAVRERPNRSNLYYVNAPLIMRLAAEAAKEIEAEDDDADPFPFEADGAQPETRKSQATEQPDVSTKQDLTRDEVISRMCELAPRIGAVGNRSTWEDLIDQTEAIEGDRNVLLVNGDATEIEHLVNQVLPSRLRAEIVLYENQQVLVIDTTPLATANLCLSVLLGRDGALTQLPSHDLSGYRYSRLLREILNPSSIDQEFAAKLKTARSPEAYLYKCLPELLSKGNTVSN